MARGRSIGVIGLTALFFLVGGIGCVVPGAVSYTAVNPPPHAFERRTPDSVEVFMGDGPTRPHVDVGMFQIQRGQDGSFTCIGAADLLTTMRRHAALRGCDALHIFHVEGTCPAYFGIMRGTCEMYTDHGPLPPAAPPLPEEGKPCPVGVGPGGGETQVCPDPLTCESRVCVSPYR